MSEHSAICTKCGVQVTQSGPLPAYVTRYLCQTCFADFERRLQLIEHILVRHFQDLGYEPEKDIDPMWRVSLASPEVNLTKIAVDINEVLD
jgi:hypothetical protein